MANVAGGILLTIVLVVVLLAYNRNMGVFEWTFDGTHHWLEIGAQK